jgi:hypothetical protein
VQSVTDEMLLASPEWRVLTDLQLARAVTLAKKRGRQTAELVHAQSVEQGNPLLLEKVATIDLYLRHCVSVVPDSKRLLPQWGAKNAVEACADPRLSWFCIIYQRTRWKVVGNGTPPKASLLMLQKIRDKQFHNLSVAQQQYSTQVLTASIYGVSDPDTFGIQLKQLHTEFMTHMDSAMLSVMSLNVATEEWIANE